jgi:predicted dehydrogenase
VVQGATSCWPGDRARLELHGERGTIVLEEGRIVHWKLADAKEGEEERMLALEESLGSGSQDPTAISYEMHRRQIQDMVEAIHEDREPAVPGSEARKAVEIILGIYRSSQTGMQVRLPLE